MNLFDENKLKIKEWVINWFLINSNATQNNIKNNLNENYLETGWIDSLQFVSFISDIENEFKIRFDNDEFQNKEFSNISGLSELIKEKMKINV